MVEEKNSSNAAEEKKEEQKAQPEEKKNEKDTAQTKAVTATPPKYINESEQTVLVKKSEEIVTKFGENVTDWKMIEQITGVGMEAQIECSEEINLLNRKIGNIIDVSKGPGQHINKGITDLTKKLDEINPHIKLKEAEDLKKMSFWRKGFRKIPKIGDILAEIATKHTTVNEQVADMKASLIGGKDMLDRDNADLKRLFSNVEQKQIKVQKNAYLGELLMDNLEKLMSKIIEAFEKNKVTEVLHDVSVRVQDLRVMEQQNEQFFVTMGMTINNNRRLGDAVMRTLTMAENCVAMALATLGAIQNQKKVAEANAATRTFIGDLTKQTAAMTKAQTAEIAKQYSEPSIAIEDLKTAFDDLVGAVDIYNEAQEKGIELAKQNISTLKDMSAKLSEKSAGLKSSVAKRSEKPLEA